MGKTKRGNGEGSFYEEIRTLADGRVKKFVVYSISLGFDEHGRRVRRKFAGPTKAAVKLKAEQAKAAAGGTIRRRRSDTVGEYLASWLEAVATSRSAPTARAYGDRIRRFAIPNIGKIRMDEIDAETIGGLYAMLTARGVSADNIQKLHKALRRAFNVAIGRGILTRNPVLHVERPKHRRKKMASYDPSQVATFLVAARCSRLEAMFRLAIVTTMRPGELYALERSDVDLERGHIDVRHSLEDDKGKLSIVPAKAESGRRIPLTPATIALLRARFDAADREQHGSQYVFTTVSGKWLRGNPVNAELRRISAAAGLPSLTMYGLRHTAVSLFAEAGVHIRVASDVAGHAGTEITAEVYTHAGEAMHREGVERVEALLVGVGKMEPRVEPPPGVSA